MSNMDLKKDFGKRVKELRIKMGLTQSQLAEMAGIDPKHMSHIETGRSFPKADLIERFAEALNVDYITLFKTNYLQETDVLLKKIHEFLKQANSEQIKTIYKVIESLMY